MMQNEMLACMCIPLYELPKLVQRKNCDDQLKLVDGWIDGWVNELVDDWLHILIKESLQKLFFILIYHHRRKKYASVCIYYI